MGIIAEARISSFDYCFGDQYPSADSQSSLLVVTTDNSLHFYFNHSHGDNMQCIGRDE